MPVVTPLRASMASQKAVPNCEVFSEVMGPMFRCSRRSSVIARQTRPRPYFAMKLMVSGVTFSAASVKSPSFSRSSSSTTTIIRPLRISSMAAGTSAKEGGGMKANCSKAGFKQSKDRPRAVFENLIRIYNQGLERGLDLKPPSLKERLRDVLGILVAPGPLPQPGGAQILVGREFILPHHLLKLSDGWGDRPDRFGLPPVRISASLRHGRLCLAAR